MAKRRPAKDLGEYYNRLAERLRIARRLVEPRQVDAARQCEVEARTWWRWEKGRQPIDPHGMARFCIEYDICPRFLLLGDPSGLRWPLSANLRLVPEAAKYLPEAEPLPVSPQSTGNMRDAAAGIGGRLPLVRVP